MSHINNGEYGQTVRVNFKTDLTGNTALGMTLTPLRGDTKSKDDADGVTLGSSNITEGDETWYANQYIEYVLASGDIDQAGYWRLQGTATMSATDYRISDERHITVMP